MLRSCSYPKEILSNYKSEIQNFNQDQPEEIKKCLDYNLENFYEDLLEVSMVQSVCKINSNINGKFSAHTGLTLKKFITHHRKEVGKVLLKKPNLNVVQISVLVGRTSFSSFSKTYKNKDEEMILHTWRDKNSSAGNGEIMEKYIKTIV